MLTPSAATFGGNLSQKLDKRWWNLKGMKCWSIIVPVVPRTLT
jgi:hypothetical protein